MPETLSITKTSANTVDLPPSTPLSKTEQTKIDRAQAIRLKAARRLDEMFRAACSSRLTGNIVLQVAFQNGQPGHCRYNTEELDRNYDV